jgi:hypothetical protein
MHQKPTKKVQTIELCTKNQQKRCKPTKYALKFTKNFKTAKYALKFTKKFKTAKKSSRTIRKEAHTTICASLNYLVIRVIQ